MSSQVILSFLIIVFSASVLIGQKRLSRITFKDGTVVNGFAKFLEEGKEITFFSDKDSEPVVYSYLNIEKVEMMKGNEKATYEYIQVINQGTHKLAELLKEGRVNLYKFSYEETGWGTVNLGIIGHDVSASGGPIIVTTTFSNRFEYGYYKRTYKDLCVKRDDEEMARYFKDNSLGASFKQLGAYYFQDCPELAEKIRNGKLKLGKLATIVDYYNNFCE